MVTVENPTITTDEIRCDFADVLAKLGPVERQSQVRQLLESLIDWTQNTIEEEVYLRALRAMRNR